MIPKCDEPVRIEGSFRVRDDAPIPPTPKGSRSQFPAPIGERSRVLANDRRRSLARLACCCGYRVRLSTGRGGWRAAEIFSALRQFKQGAPAGDGGAFSTRDQSKSARLTYYGCCSPRSTPTKSGWHFLCLRRLDRSVHSKARELRAPLRRGPACPDRCCPREPPYRCTH